MRATQGVSKLEYGARWPRRWPPGAQAARRGRPDAVRRRSASPTCRREPKPHQLQEILRVIATTKAAAEGRRNAGLARRRPSCASTAASWSISATCSTTWTPSCRASSGCGSGSTRCGVPPLGPVGADICRWRATSVSRPGDTRRDHDASRRHPRELSGGRNRWREELQQECLNRGVDRVELTTADAMDTMLVDYLVRRAKA